MLQNIYFSVRTRIVSIFVVVFIFSFVAVSLHAATSTNYTLTGDALGGGGGTSQSSNYLLTGSMGALGDSGSVNSSVPDTVTVVTRGGGIPITIIIPVANPWVTPVVIPSSSAQVLLSPSVLPAQTSQPSVAPSTQQTGILPAQPSVTPGQENQQVPAQQQPAVSSAPVYNPPPIPAPTPYYGPAQGQISYPGVGDRLSPSEIIVTLESGTIFAAMEDTALGRQINAFPMRPLGLVIPADKIKKPVEAIVLRLDDAYYQFLNQMSAYTIGFPSPEIIGVHPMSIAVNYKDNTTDLINFLVNVKQPPLIWSKGSIIPEPGATVIMYELKNDTWRMFDARPYNQQNPQRTDAQGHYAFVAPPGTYYLEVLKDGFVTATTNRFDVTVNTVSFDVEIIKKPPPLKLDAELPQNLQKTAIFAGRVAKHEVVKFVQNPVVKKDTETIAAPIAVTGAVANVAIAVPSIQLLTYLQYFFTQPFWFFTRRKREKWGVVYNSLTKTPVDLVIVRLVNIGTGRVVGTRVTDMQGRYAFIAPEGEFRIEVSRKGFQYPSKYLKGKQEDLQFIDLYQGQLIKAHKGAIITANIPVDPEEKTAVPKQIMRAYWKHRLQYAVASAGIIFAGLSLIVSHKIQIVILLAVHIILFSMFRRLARPRRPKSWGIVYDARSKKPVAHALVRIFETQFNKLLDSWPTDAQGRYSFLVGKSTYFVTAEKQGYEKYESSKLDLTKEAAVVDKDIPMKVAL